MVFKIMDPSICWWRVWSWRSIWNSKSPCHQTHTTYWSSEEGEFTSLLRQPLYKYTEMREPTCSGRLVPPLWEEVTQLSLAKSDSVIRPGGLGGTIWFRRATGRKSRKMSNEGKRKKQNMKNRAHCVKSCTLRCVISQARKPVSEETIKQENANRGWVSRQGTAV